MTLKQLFIALFVGAVLIQAGLTTCAKAEPPYTVTLEDEHGRPLPTYAHRSEWFALGQEGKRYNVRVTNRTSRRVEAVVSVDGRDVLSGQPGDFKNQRGYLINAHDSVLIEGFRTSLHHVAAFRFSAPADSYSARMGTPENVGVIGVALFPEAAPPRVVRRPMIPRDIEGPRGRAPTRGESRGGSAEAKRSRGAPASSAPAAEASADESASNIGTEYGEQRYSAVHEVPFRRARPQHPERVLLVRYDDREGLIARGILPRPAPRPYRGPKAFPVSRFAPPPPPRSYWN